ncbi:hybrid sensor histidine kinase/response regulator [Catenovulum agarivorans]|uniref:hybrid sensor histidine kinase/response regulator n=1 Tax=Catenovulum agarivorans TaxID=1172192 RepID=UPI0002ED40F3|nr:hybrid sensor histidine kinase/response regulator [Catenovulum agarivorans]
MPEPVAEGVYALSFLRTFHNIVTDQTLKFEDKVHSLLTFGLQVFELDIAIISKIQQHNYRVEYVACFNNELAAGAEFPLGNTYCVHTLKAGQALAFHHAGESEIATHPCYQGFQLESYIGAPIQVDGNSIGTVNFSATKISQPFTQQHIDYIELFAQWLGAEIARRKTIEQLEQNNQTLGKLEQAANIGTWQLDLTNNALEWSQQTKIIHEVAQSYQPELATALTFYNEGTSRQTIQQAVEDAINSGEGWNLELEITTAKNKLIWIATQGSAEFENGKCVRLFGTVQDITDAVELKNMLARQKEAAELMLNERSKLFAKISHELRTPLNGIVGMLNAAMTEQNPQELKQQLTVALRSSDILLSIINEVLDYSKISHGELKLEPSHFLLKDVFNDLTNLFTSVCTNKSIQLNSHLQIADDVAVYFDSTRLSQIVSNLLSNAIKFTEQGAVTLSVVACKSDKSAEYVDLNIAVSDTGIGMTAETITALFKPFNQGASNITQKYGGTGLGLSIVKELIEMMQGQVSVSSEFGHGSTFNIRLQLPVGSVQAQTHITDTADNEIDLSSLAVLVVDDNEINRIVMTSCLSQFNINADIAIDGKDAVEKCRAEKYDLIFMDCIMPIMDGWQATQVLRADKLVTEKAIIAALTANTSESDQLKCEQAGMNLFITKPVQNTAIKNALASAAQAARNSADQSAHYQ